MVDGTRKRRDCENPTKNRWYAMHRAQRFRKRFGVAAEVPEKSVRAFCCRLEQHSHRRGPSDNWG